MVFSDVRMPERQDGVDFITKVRRRWSNLPLVVLTGYPDDLEELLGTPECPVLILAKPAWPDQIREALRLGLGAQISNAEAVPVAD
jgi:CheY-like chemotaxis protein